MSRRADCFADSQVRCHGDLFTTPAFVETSANMTTPIVVPGMINTTHQLMKKMVTRMESTKASSFSTMNRPSCAG
jgi:hypothetical protein